MKRALVVLTRNPFTKPSGRKKVLRTIIDSLERGGCLVDLAILDREPTTRVPHAGAVFWLGTPGLASLLLMGWVGLLKGLSLNECLYFSRKTKRQVDWIAETGCYHLIVGDMVRTAPLLVDCATTSHLHLDMDDLLSARYAKWCSGGEGSEALLGYFEDRIPRFLLKPLAWGARRMLSWESKRLASREVFWAKFADSVSLVSATEASSLAATIGRDVEALPMAVRVPPTSTAAPNAPVNRAVFVGGMRYQPNLDAVRFYCKKIAPLLVANGLEEFCLDVIGEAPADTIADLIGCRQVHFRSFVDDLDEALSEYSLFLAPLVSGETGVKTKILEAFAAGLPVITSSYGTTGLQIKNRVHYLEAHRPEEFVEAIKSAVANPSAYRKIAVSGHRYVQEHFSTSVIAARWKDRILSRLSHPESEQQTWELTIIPGAKQKLMTGP